MSSRITSFIVATAAIAIAPAAAAQSLIIRDVAGVIEIETSADIEDISVELGAASDLVEAPVRRDDDGAVVIDGGMDMVGCGGGRRSVARARGDGLRATPVTELQTVTVRAPASVELELRLAAANVTAGDLGALDLTLDGCGRIETGDIDGDVRIENNGVGDITIGDAHAGRISSNGAGIVRAGRLAGASVLESNGVGDIEVAAVLGDLDAEVNGPATIEIGELQGDFRGSANGFGDVIIDEGRAERFNASANGIGASVRFGGVAEDADLSANGFAGITVQRVEGALTREANLARVRVRERGADD